MTRAADSSSAPPDPAAIQHVFQLATGYMVSAALGAVTRLGIPDHLAGGARSAAHLARATGANEDALYRTLRALAMTGVFAEDAERTFVLTPAGQLLRSGVPGSVRDMVLWMCDDFHFRVWAELLHGVRTGETVDRKVLGMPVFEYLSTAPDVSERFNNAMTNFSAGVAPALLAAYDFSGIDVLVDVAGGHGMLLGSILQRYPNMRGVLLDLDHVLKGSTVLDSLGVRDRVQTVAGDFFTEIPAGGDAYIMKHIIHDWNDERAGVILRNVRKALAGKPHGRVILVDAVVKPSNEPDLNKLIDLEMLLLPGGKERTEAEFAALFAANGFALTRVVPTDSPLAVIEGKVRQG